MGLRQLDALTGQANNISNAKPEDGSGNTPGNYRRWGKSSYLRASLVTIPKYCVHRLVHRADNPLSCKCNTNLVPDSPSRS